MKDEATLRDALQRIHRVATGQSDRSYMSIPADRARDADLILSDAIDELIQLRAQREELAAALRRFLEVAFYDDVDSEARRLARAALAKMEVKP